MAITTPINVPVSQSQAGAISFRAAQPIQGRMLGQLMPAVITPISIYSPAEGVVTEVTKIIVANTSGSSVDFTIYHDEAGTTYDNSTTIKPTTPLAAQGSEQSAIGELPIYMINPAGNLAVQTSVASALTFTVYGLETQVRAR